MLVLKMECIVQTLLPDSEYKGIDYRHIKPSGSLIAHRSSRIIPQLHLFPTPSSLALHNRSSFGKRTFLQWKVAVPQGGKYLFQVLERILSSLRNDLAHHNSEA